jgi:hypothetical protein
MTVNANMVVTTNRPSDDKPTPVEFFLSGNMIINSGARLSGKDSGDGQAWSRFRIFGFNSSRGCDSQTVTINSTTTTPKQTNLQNAFLWLNNGKLANNSETPITSIPSLAGFACKLEGFAQVTNLSDLSSRKFFEGLGGAYAFKGVFGGAAPIRFYYRGFGSSEQSISEQIIYP